MIPAGGSSGATPVESVGLAMGNADWFPGRDPVIVAVSGGVDSMVLLYLLRFVAGCDPDRIHVGHLDHAARTAGAADARWLRGVCVAWGVAYHGARMDPPMTTEDEGRKARYRFLDGLRREVGAAAVLTGHTADDQAETVLFRMARGAGLRGLAGIHPRRRGGVERPLLEVWRTSIDAFARARAVPFRVDPSNRDPRWTRNRLRHDVLPSLEEAVPGARSALARLASLAAADVHALAGLADALLAAWGRSLPGGHCELDAKRLEGLDDVALGALLRRACQRAGASPGAGATEALVDFVRSPGDGGFLDVGGGVRIHRSMGRIRVSPEATAAEPPGALGGTPAEVELTRDGGRGRWRMGGTEVEVTWGAERPRGYEHVAAFPLDALRFPLVLRSRVPGDRIRRAEGDRKVKEILARERVPSFARHEVPILADGSGAVLWVVGYSDPAPPFGPATHRPLFFVAVRTATGGMES